MKTIKKRKTAKSGSITLWQPSQQRHMSSTNSIGLDKAKFVALEFIQSLLVRVEEEDNLSEGYIQTINIFSKYFCSADDDYFRTEEAVHDQHNCKVEQEPQSDQPMVMGMLNKQLTHKRTSIDRFKGSCQNRQSLKSIRKINAMEQEKRDKQMVIQKLKRNYLAIINSHYLSQSKPLGETRKYFQDTEGPETTTLRNRLSRNQNFPTDNLRKCSRIMEPKRCKNLSILNPTVFGNTRHKQNGINNFESCNSLGSRNRNMNYLGQSVLMKQTDLNEVGDSLKPLKSIYERPSITQELQKEHIIGESHNKSQDTHDSLQAQVNHYLSDFSKIKIKQIFSGRQDRNCDRDAQLVSFLPKIGRR